MKRKYSQLQSRMSPYEKLFELLKSASEQDAQHMLGKVRSGLDVDTLLSRVAEGDLLMQLSTVPETRYRYKFPYISTMPESLLIGHNPYLQSLIYEATDIYPSPKEPGPSKESSSLGSMSFQSINMPHRQEHEPTMHMAIYLKPFHAAHVVDPRLSNVKISSWTSVCDDDTLMQNLLADWLLCEYQTSAAFQKDLFLEDLATGREDFCSSLLVNVILGYACVLSPHPFSRVTHLISS